MFHLSKGTLKQPCLEIPAQAVVKAQWFLACAGMLLLQCVAESKPVFGGN